MSPTTFHQPPATTESVALGLARTASYFRFGSPVNGPIREGLEELRKTAQHLAIGFGSVESANEQLDHGKVAKGAEQSVILAQLYGAFLKLTVGRPDDARAKVIEAIES